MEKSEVRIQNPKGRPFGRLLFFFWILTSGFWILAGCKSSHPTTQPTTKPMTAVERQNAAKKDPFNYDPFQSDGGKSRVSGGGIGDYDKQGINGDMKRLFDP
jgi:hypothetical protein